MRWHIELLFEDRDGNQRRCIMHAEGLSTIPDVIAFASAFGERVEALSTAYLISGRVSTRVAPTVVTTAQPGSDVRRKLLILLQQNEQIGSLLIPSPAANLPWETDGPYAGFRILKSDLPANNQLVLAMEALNTTVRPDGLPISTENWIIALLSD